MGIPHQSNQKSSPRKETSDDWLKLASRLGRKKGIHTALRRLRKRGRGRHHSTSREKGFPAFTRIEPFTYGRNFGRRHRKCRRKREGGNPGINPNAGVERTTGKKIFHRRESLSIAAAKRTFANFRSGEMIKIQRTRMRRRRL